MNWIFLSPHLDDVALSCAGLVWELAQAGEGVQVWTICAGSPPAGELSPFASSLHRRWETGDDATRLRREEDLLACRRMQAECRHFSIPDCIYRRDSAGNFLYADEEALFGEFNPAEESLVSALSAELQQHLTGDAQVVSPLTIGGHVDHQLTRRAAEALQVPLWYYADYPYILKEHGGLERLQQQGWEARLFPVSPQGLQAWQDAVAAYRSQISSFWAGEGEMRAAMQAYCEEMNGVRLWRKGAVPPHP